MPIWSSSERPISVRTVWVDGIRHAILSPDDPLINSESRRRSRVSRSKCYSTDYQQLGSRPDRLNSCFTNLQMIVSNNSSDTKTPTTKVCRKLSAPPWTRTFSGMSDSSTVESLLGNNIKIQKKHCDHKTSKGDINIFLEKRAVKSNTCEWRSPKSELDVKLSRTECKEAVSDTFWNPLFERVLQWLDLSGRSRSYDFVDNFARRSSREEGQKRRLPHLKRDSFEGKGRIIEEKYKLQKDSAPEYCKGKDSKILQRRLPKIKNTRAQLGENDEASVVSVPYELNSVKMPSHLDEEELRNDVKEKASSTIWCPPGRLKLHVVIPSIVSRENHMSSQESLIND